MTREEAISRIKNHMIIHKMNEPRAILIDEALAMAIKALEQEPCREADDYENEISDLYNRLDIVEYDKERLREEVTTLEEKLKGLSAEPCEDAISREAVLDIVNNPLNVRLDEIIKKLPPVTPQPKTGHWINKSQRSGCGVLFVASECTCCGKKTPFNCDEFLYRYCPNCGCTMVEPQESEK